MYNSITSAQVEYFGLDCEPEICFSKKLDNQLQLLASYKFTCSLALALMISLHNKISAWVRATFLVSPFPESLPVSLNVTTQRHSGEKFRVALCRHKGSMTK